MDFKKELLQHQKRTQARFNAMDAKLSIVKDTLSSFQQDLSDQKTDLDELYNFIGRMYDDFNHRFEEHE